MVNDLPSGHIDLAPPFCAILGLESPQKLDGRILSEAMTGQSPPAECHDRGPGSGAQIPFRAIGASIFAFPGSARRLISMKATAPSTGRLELFRFLSFSRSLTEKGETASRGDRSGEMMGAFPCRRLNDYSSPLASPNRRIAQSTATLPWRTESLSM
jgi:hypothetical protein